MLFSPVIDVAAPDKVDVMPACLLGAGDPLAHTARVISQKAPGRDEGGWCRDDEDTI